MNTIARFNTDGRYTAILSANQEGIDRENQSAIYIGIVNPLTHYHDFSLNGPVALPPQPTPHHTFNWGSKTWSDPRTLQNYKDAAWTAIKASREAAIDAPLATPYGSFDSGAKDRTNITDAVLMLQTLAGLGNPTTIDFTLSNNSTVTLTTAQMVTVGLLLGQKVQTAHGTARARRAAIEAATTAQQLAAITW